MVLLWRYMQPITTYPITLRKHAFSCSNVLIEPKNKKELHKILTKIIKKTEKNVYLMVIILCVLEKIINILKEIKYLKVI